MHTGRKRWRTHLLVLSAYAVFALALTWPLVLNIGSHVPGNGVDDPPLTWNLWWIRYALLDQGANPFDGSHLFHPLGINLAFYTLTVLNGLLSIPLQAVLGLIPASNILLLSSFVLSGYGAFLLIRYLLGPPEHDAPWRSLLAPFAGGLLYAFASSKMAYAALGQWNIASSQWIPFYTLYLLKMTDAPGKWRYPLLAALFLLFQAYAEITYATFLILWTALWALWQAVACLRTRDAHTAGRLAANLVLVGLIFLVGLAPILAMMLPDMLAEGDIMVEGGGFADVFSADLLGYLVPSEYHPLFGSLVELFGFDYGVGQHLYLGYAVLALAIVGIVAWRRRASHHSPPVPGGCTGSGIHGPGFWTVSALVFWLLTLGPSLRLNGHDTGLPLPFALVARLPFFEGNRYPSRYSVILFLCLAVLVAMGLAALLRRSERKRLLLPVSLGLVALFLFEHLSAPLPLSDMRIPPVYETVAREVPGEATLLDLPVAWRNGFRVTGTQHPIIMFSQYYQSGHGKRLLSGNTSRNPPLKFQYFTEAPVINTLIALETDHTVDPAVIEADRAVAADVLRFFDIQAIVVHPAQTGPQMIPYLEATMPLAPIYPVGEQIAYRVDLPPWPAAWTIEPGDPLSHLSYAEGWGLPAGGTIWAQRRSARLLVPMDGHEQRMAFRAYAPEQGQGLQAEFNGRQAGHLDLAPGWGDYELTLPAEAVQEGLNEVWLHFETLYPADLCGPSPRSIGQTGVESPANVVVHSAGQEVGSFGHIYVNGENISPSERGYNVAVLHPQTGAVEQAAAFDTHDDAEASRALAAFLADVPQGHVVAVAAADEVSRLLGAEAVEALRGIGAGGDLRDRFRWGHAILGVQGAPPGSALEALDWMRPVAVVAGEGATEPNLTAAFGPIAFSATGR